MQKIFYFALFLLLTVTACKKDNPVTNEVEALETTEETPAINNEVYEIMKQWYLWNQELPEVDLASYSNPNDLMKALAWHPNDRWSYVGQASTYSSFYDEGQFVGHGFGSTWYEDGIRILNFVYEDSPAYRAGLRRGFTIESVNGTPISNINSFSSSLGANEVGFTNTLVVKDLDGNLITVDLEKDVVTMNTVLHTQIEEVGDRKVGYLVFKSFVNPSIEELTNAFSEFKAEGVNEVVLDLRYNGGGRVSVAMHLMNWLVPLSANGQTAFTYEHNPDRMEENDTVIPFDSIDYSMNLNRVFVLTSLSTASASELVINCLDPHMEVIQIGYDTYGKPVGSYGFTSEDNSYVISPISLRLVNANGIGNYFTGLEPDSYTTDNPEAPFGSAEEWGYQQALHYIENGEFADFGKTFHAPYIPLNPENIHPLWEEIGAN